MKGFNVKKSTVKHFVMAINNKPDSNESGLFIHRS